MKLSRMALVVAALGAALFIFGGLTRAADVNFPIYFPDSKLIVKADVMNRTLYLPLREILAILRRFRRKKPHAAPLHAQPTIVTNPEE